MNYSKEELIEKLGIGALDDDVQEQVLGTFLNTLDKRTGMVVSGHLTDEQLKEFDAVIAEKGDEAGEDWLREKVPGFDDIEQEQTDALIAEATETE